MNIISLFLWSQCTVFKLNNERLMVKKLTTVQRMTMPMTMRATAKVRQGSSKPVGWSVLATCLVSSTSFRWTRSWWRRRRRRRRRRWWRRKRQIELIGGGRGSGRDTTWSFLSIYFDWSLWEIKFFDEKQRSLRSIFHDVRIWKKWQNPLGNSW